MCEGLRLGVRGKPGEVWAGRPGHYHGNECCFVCKCSFTGKFGWGHPWDFTENGPCHTACLTREEFEQNPPDVPIFDMATRPPPEEWQRNNWHSIPGMTLGNVRLDLYHCGPLGLWRTAAGTVLETLVIKPKGIPRGGQYPGSDQFVKVNNLNAAAQAIYSDMGVKVNQRFKILDRIQWSSTAAGTSATKYPELREKGGIVRHLMPVLLRICLDLGRQHTLPVMQVYLRMRVLLLQGATNIMHICDSEGQFMSEESIQHLEVAVNNVISSTLWLSHFFRRRGLFMMKVSVKLHYLVHILQGVKKSHINPQFLWVPRDEDYISRLAHLVRASVRGSGPLGLSLSYTERYLTGLAVRWARTDAGQRARASWANY